MGSQFTMLSGRFLSESVHPVIMSPYCGTLTYLRKNQGIKGAGRRWQRSRVHAKVNPLRCSTNVFHRHSGYRRRRV
ncbi:hypothetical protein KCP78_09560 [Salmonella enterica subsp. enterica]|nr:hypothetical protein KCP78_09560 [Salmonella enterica subsp. enterica]